SLPHLVEHLPERYAIAPIHPLVAWPPLVGPPIPPGRGVLLAEVHLLSAPRALHLQRPLSIDAGKRACSSACAAPFGCARKSSPNQDGGYRAQMWVSLALLETFHTCAGAVLILLGRATTNPAGAYQHTTAEDRHGTLAEKHVVALGHDNPAQRRMVGAWSEVAARTAKRGRSYGLALATIGTCPHGAIHALKCHQPTTRVTHGDVHLCADLSCLGDGTRNHKVRICKRQSHARYSPSLWQRWSRAPRCRSRSSSDCSQGRGDRQG